VLWHLPDTSLERQSAISAARIGSGARAFGAEVVKFTIRAAYLTVEKASAVSQIRVILTELIAGSAELKEDAALEICQRRR